MLGYHGRYLDIDLSTESHAWQQLEEPVLRRFLGGVGLGTYLLLKTNTPEVDPFDPQSAIVFAFSPLVGSPLTTSAKFAVVGKSPLTYRINDSLASSGFAISGKRTGSDAIVVRGKAAQPSIVVVDNDTVRLEDAQRYRGLTCSETEQALRSDLGTDFDFAVIGPAGENKVLFATISHDGRHAGRGGSGAILGSKNIKAIAVRGNQKVTFADPPKLNQYAKTLSKASFGPATEKYRELGTMSNLLVFNRLNALPTRNFQQGSFEAAEDLSPEKLSVAKGKVNASCAACTIGCEHIYSIEGSRVDRKGDGRGVRLEYENVFALGSLCDITDVDAVLAASNYCDEMGMDTISAGATLAFAMECVERRLLDEPWIKFGDGQALQDGLRMIAHRESIGDKLAQGSARLARELGAEAEAIAPTVKQLELPGYDPRAMQTMALGFAVGTRGADHNRSGAYEVDFSEKVDRRSLSIEAVPLAIDVENKAALIDSLILCKFLRGVFDDLLDASVDMLNMTAGWDLSRNELATTIDRIIAARKLFNIRAGWQEKEDSLPDRFLNQTLSDDPRAKLSGQTLADCITEYYRLRNWRTDGMLDDAEISRLDLSELQSEL